MGSICETSPQWQRKTRLSYRRHPSTRKKTNPSHPRWKLENSLIISWLIKMNDPSIVKSYLFLPTAKDVWEVVNNFYSRLEKSSLIYELKTLLWKSKQGCHNLLQSHGYFSLETKIKK